MERSLLIALTGNPRSGKTTSARYLQENHGFSAVSGSSILRFYAAVDNVTLNTRQDYDAYHKRAVSKYGPSFVVSYALELHASNLVFDGLRNRQDFARFKRAGGIVVSLWCPAEERQHRDATTNLLDLREAEQAEYDSSDPNGSHTLSVMQQADFHIDANTKPEIIYERLDQILLELRQ